MASKALRDFVIGMSDGLTVPFALAAGLSGASLLNSTILTAGISEVVAGAISMGLGGYLAGKTEVEHYSGELSREQYEIKHSPEVERQEVEEILEKYGISPEARKAVIRDLERDEQKWIEFMMRFELGLEKPDPREARYSAIRVGGSYAVGGLVPLIPYVFTHTPQSGLMFSAGVTLMALGIFGFLKSRVTAQPAFAGALRVVGVGAVAASAAYFIARLIV